jgi:hypothetical protein
MALFVDEGVVMVSQPELDGLMVIPGQHVGGLEELSVAHRAQVLAALRRATLSVQESHQGASIEVVPMIDLPGSPGHVCFQVVPADAPPPPPSGGPPA